MNNLTVSQPDLSQIFGNQFSVIPAAEAYGQHQMAQQNQQVNQAGALQELFQNEQMNPLRVRNAQLNNETAEAQLPGIFAANEAAQRTNRKAAALEPSDIEAGISTNKAKVGANKSAERSQLAEMLRQLGSAAEQGLSLEDLQLLPPELQKIAAQPGGGAILRKLGESLGKGTANVYEESEKQKAMQDRQMALERERTARAMEVQELRSSAALALAKARQEAIEKKAPNTLQAVAARFLEKAKLAGTPETRNMYREMANEALAVAYQFNEGIRRAGQAGQIDTPAVAGLPSIQPQPAPQLAPPTTNPGAPTQSQAPAGGGSLADVQKMYPGVPPEKLREAYKKKFGVDLK